MVDKNYHSETVKFSFLLNLVCINSSKVMVIFLQIVNRNFIKSVHPGKKESKKADDFFCNLKH